MKLPEHKCSLSITHNQHKDYYETIEQYLDRDDKPWEDFENIDAYKKSIETNEIWEIQWYPDTPVGFCIVKASTLEDALRLANPKS